MEMDVTVEEIDLDKINSFVNSLSSSYWMLEADESVIDDVMTNSADIQEYFSREPKGEFDEKIRASHPDLDFEKSLDLLMENLIKSSNLNERLTLYAIRKYLLLSPANNLSAILENILVEMKLRENLTRLYEILSDGNVVDVDWHKIDSLLQEVNSAGSDDVCDYKILNALKTQTSILLNSINHGREPSGKVLLSKMIDCLESQNDLKLWFAVMKERNMGLILDLCSKHNNFLEAVLKFFDRFAEEVETNYDEDLNFKYSHLNLDFDEFVELVKLFLAEEKTSGIISEYIENKIFHEDKNFLFWIDVKACI